MTVNIQWGRKELGSFITFSPMLWLRSVPVVQSAGVVVHGNLSCKLHSGYTHV